MHFDLDHIILYLILFLIFCITGKNVSYRHPYWINAIGCIIFYTIISGLRYDRGGDYFPYIQNYIYGTIDDPFGYTLIKDIMKSLDINHYAIFSVYAFITISCGMVFLSKYHEYALYMFPSFLLATFILAEYQIRQSLSYGFVFLFLIYLFKIHIYKFIDLFAYKNISNLIIGSIYVLIAVSIHPANLINVFLLSLLFIFVRTPVPYWISIPLVIISSYVIPRVYNISMIEPVLEIIADQDELFSGYVEQQDRWFSGYSTDYAENPIIKVFELLGNISLLYFGRKAILIDNKKEGVTLYNFFFIGTCIVLAFKLMEIAARVGMNMQLFWFYPLALSLYYRKRIVVNKYEKCLFFFLIFWIYAFFKFLFVSERTFFLWDKV